MEEGGREFLLLRAVTGAGSCRWGGKQLCLRRTCRSCTRCEARMCQIASVASSRG